LKGFIVLELEKKFLASRMKRAVHFFEILAVDVRVNLRGGNIGVSQHLLDGPEICSSL
jgi:hypothetical protein